MVSAFRTALENLITLTPVRRGRRTREALESAEETQTLLNCPCGGQSSAKYLSKGFPERSPPCLPHSGGALGMGTKWIMFKGQKEKRKKKKSSYFE